MKTKHLKDMWGKTSGILGKTKTGKIVSLHDKEVMDKFEDKLKGKNPTHRKWEREKSAQEYIDES